MLVITLNLLIFNSIKASECSFPKTNTKVFQASLGFQNLKNPNKSSYTDIYIYIYNLTLNFSLSSPSGFFLDHNPFLGFCFFL